MADCCRRARARLRIRWSAYGMSSARMAARRSAGTDARRDRETGMVWTSDGGGLRSVRA